MKNERQNNKKTRRQLTDLKEERLLASSYADPRFFASKTEKSEETRSRVRRLTKHEKLDLLIPSYVDPAHRRSHTDKKLGFDLHGVVDTNPETFRMIFASLIKDGWEIHIITGAPWSKERETLEKLRLPFTHFFSIVDYHVSIGTKIAWDEAGNAHIDEYKWDQTKGLYCKKHGIRMHADDSDIYGYFFTTPYVRYYSKDSARVRKLHIVSRTP